MSASLCGLIIRAKRWDLVVVLPVILCLACPRWQVPAAGRSWTAAPSVTLDRILRCMVDDW